MKAKLIDTPCGRKTPELLCKAMDAYERQPALLAALEAMLFATAKADGQIAKEARKIAVSAIAAAKGGKL